MANVDLLLQEARKVLWADEAHQLMCAALQVGGCDEGGVFEGQYAYQSCTLMQLPQHSDPYTWSRGPEASSFSSGWVTGAALAICGQMACC